MRPRSPPPADVLVATLARTHELGADRPTRVLTTRIPAKAVPCRLARRTQRLDAKLAGRHIFRRGPATGPTARLEDRAPTAFGRPSRSRRSPHAMESPRQCGAPKKIGAGHHTAPGASCTQCRLPHAAQWRRLCSPLTLSRPHDSPMTDAQEVVHKSPNSPIAVTCQSNFTDWRRNTLIVRGCFLNIPVERLPESPVRDACSGTPTDLSTDGLERPSAGKLAQTASIRRLSLPPRST